MIGNYMRRRIRLYERAIRMVARTEPLPYRGLAQMRLVLRRNLWRGIPAGGWA